jgi:hypothetical protein
MQISKILVRLRGADAITDPEVAQALRLSETQKIRIQDVRRQSSESFRQRIRDLVRTAGRKVLHRDTLRQLRDESQQPVLAMLNGEQKDRFSRLQGDSN